MNNLMIDLETMGNRSCAPIVAIGAVFFDPNTGEIGESFSSTVLLSSEMALGAEPDDETIMWWLRQSERARAAIQTGPLPIQAVLVSLNKFINKNADPKYLRVWGNGASFDNVILRAAYRRTDIPAPWLFFNDRDVRTIVELGRQIGIDPKRDLPFDGEQHTALDDALHQARYVSVIWQRLIQSTSTDKSNNGVING